MAEESPELEITPTVEGERLVFKLSRPVNRLGFTLEEWRGLVRAGEELAEVIEEVDQS